MACDRVDHIKATISVPFVPVRVASGETLLGPVLERDKGPDPALRWCTSTKRGPIEREIRRP